MFAVVTLVSRQLSGVVTLGFQNGGMGCDSCRRRCDEHNVAQRYEPRSRDVPAGGRWGGVQRSALQIRGCHERDNLADGHAGRLGDASQPAPLLIVLSSLYRFAAGLVVR